MLNGNNNSVSSSPSTEMSTEGTSTVLEFVRDGIDWSKENYLPIDPRVRSGVSIFARPGKKFEIGVSMKFVVGRTREISGITAERALEDMRRFWNTTLEDKRAIYRITLDINKVLMENYDIEKAQTAPRSGKPNLFMRPCYTECDTGEVLGLARGNIIELPESFFVDEAGGVRARSDVGTGAHELGHVLGLDHRFHEKGSIMSYDAPIKVTLQDAKVLANLYLGEFP